MQDALDDEKTCSYSEGEEGVDGSGKDVDKCGKVGWSWRGTGRQRHRSVVVVLLMMLMMLMMLMLLECYLPYYSSYHYYHHYPY